jgi:hypothetical protein
MNSFNKLIALFFLSNLSSAFAQANCDVSKVVFNDGGTAQIEFASNPWFHPVDKWLCGDDTKFCVISINVSWPQDPTADRTRVRRAVTGVLPGRITRTRTYTPTYPVSDLWIDTFYKDNKRLPNEEEYQTFKKQFEIDYWNNKRNELAFQKNLDAEDKLKELSRQREFVEYSKICSGIPRVNLTSIEEFSSFLGVTPDSIKLNRVTSKQDLDWFGNNLQEA